MNILTTKEQRNERLAICRKCEHLKQLTRCDKCGCIMTAKTFLANEACPIGKWHNIVIVPTTKEKPNE